MPFTTRQLSNQAIRELVRSQPPPRDPTAIFSACADPTKEGVKAEMVWRAAVDFLQPEGDLKTQCLNALDSYIRRLGRGLAEFDGSQTAEWGTMARDAIALRELLDSTDAKVLEDMALRLRAGNAFLL